MPVKRDPLGVMQDSKLLKEASIELANEDGVSQSLTSQEGLQTQIRIKRWKMGVWYLAGSLY
jgi:uncharacterized protein YabE (DUF348 family)